MARVAFTVTERWPIDSQRVWDALVDWAGHAEWVPATTVRIESGDGGHGTVFIARTGLGPLAFDDTMQVVQFDPTARTASVRKLGPLLTGTAGFTVVPEGSASRLEWFEDVEVPRLPNIATPLARGVARLSFRLALGRLRRTLT